MMGGVHRPERELRRCLGCTRRGSRLRDINVTGWGRTLPEARGRWRARPGAADTPPASRIRRQPWWPRRGRARRWNRSTNRAAASAGRLTRRDADDERAGIVSRQRPGPAAASLAGALGGVAREGSSRTFNTEPRCAAGLASCSTWRSRSSTVPCAREESRGHQRTDSRHGRPTLRHSAGLATHDGSCRVEHLPVTITRWPPGGRYTRK